jgi:NAD(P)-dependent dehydrogenase (short-subunit alcohol dehydrogenase family)
VFDYLSRWHHVAEWDPGVVSARRLDGGLPAVGGRFDLVLALGTGRVPMRYEITAMDAPQLLVLAGRGNRFRVEDRIQMRATAIGTELSYTATVRFDQPPGLMADRIGRRLFARYADRAVGRLERMLAGGPKPPRLTPLTRLADGALLPGLMGFTRLGYMSARGRRPAAAGLYRGKTMVLTGGTSGIGRAAARALYRRGAHLVVVGRDAGKLRELGAELQRIPDGGRLDTEVADLSLLAEVRRLADRVSERYRRIDVLINNAGALFNHYRETAEGIEMTLATDLISPYLLTRLLLPALRRAEGARIINVASGGMYTQAMRPQMLTPDPQRHDGPTAYARAKRGLVILTERWARELAPANISVHAMHPGWVDTPGLARSLPSFHRHLSPWLRTPAQGADTIVWLAAAPDAAKAPGRFWLDRKIRRTHVFRRTRTTPQEDGDLVRALDRLAGL